MFATQIRNAALALAFAALTATTALATVAAAAPAADGLPNALDHEIVAAKPKLNLPHADARVTALQAQNDNGTIIYKFNIKNRGPEEARINLRAVVGYLNDGSLTPPAIEYNTFTILANGVDQEIGFPCPQPNVNAQCSGAVLYAQTLGIDPDDSDNAAWIDGPAHF